MLYDGDTFEHKGRTFKVAFPFDDQSDTPWERADGHGPVSEWKRHAYGMGSKPPKAPGERILVWDRGSYRTYDVAEATRIAKRDGWGLAKDKEAAFAQRLGRAPTRGELVAAAVESDFQFLSGWCNDQWHYVGVVVTLLDGDDDETDESDSIWGIESCAGEYLEETAHELADEICSRVDAVMACNMVAERPDMYPPA